MDGLCVKLFNNDLFRVVCTLDQKDKKRNILVSPCFFIAPPLLRLQTHYIVWAADTRDTEMHVDMAQSLSLRPPTSCGCVRLVNNKRISQINRCVRCSSSKGEVIQTHPGEEGFRKGTPLGSAGAAGLFCYLCWRPRIEAADWGKDFVTNSDSHCWTHCPDYALGGASAKTLGLLVPWFPLLQMRWLA